MTALFLTITTSVAALGLDSGLLGPSTLALFVDQSGVLQAAYTRDAAVAWSLETGGPMVWAERLENCQQALFYPRLSGELFLMRNERAPLQRFESTVQELAKAGTAEFDWEYYFQGSVQSSAYSVNLLSGEVVPPSSHSDCALLRLERVDYRVDLIEKKRLVAVSHINVSEISVRGCLETDPSTAMLEYEKIRRRFGEVRFLGFYTENQFLDDWVWLTRYPKTLFFFIFLSAFLGFLMGKKGEVKQPRITISPCKSPHSELATASTSAFTSPTLSEKTSPKEALGRKISLSINTHFQQSATSRELETPLHTSSDAKIKDLISDGRFAETFEGARLLHQRNEQKVFQAKHKLEGKAYVVKVKKFTYHEAEAISEVTMFREVAAMMRFHHKHIVNYVTCWVENEDATAAYSVPLPEDSDDEDCGPELRPVTPSSDQRVGYLYIQRELVKGESLKEWLKHREQVDRRENCLIFRQILKAVAHIHGKNIVHRRLQPSSIIVTPEDVVKVSDFRLAAKACSRSTRRSVVNSSSPYTAPEYGQQSEVTKPIDIYPLGLVLLEMCTPLSYSVSERRDILRSVRAKQTLPHWAESTMGAEKEVVMWLCARAPSDRPSAEELLDSELLRQWEKEVGLSPYLVGQSPLQAALA